MEWSKVLALLAALFLFCCIIKTCADEANIKQHGIINGRALIELEDGHWYLRSNGAYDNSLIHYPECPKCNKHEKE